VISSLISCCLFSRLNVCLFKKLFIYFTITAYVVNESRMLSRQANCVSF